MNDNKLISIAYDTLDINVSLKLIDRALEFYNLLIIGVRRIWGTISVKQNRSAILFSGETLEMTLREKQNRIEKENPKYSWESYDYVPSGLLYFKLGEDSWNSKEWKDTAYTVVEDKIEDILQHIQKVVIKIQKLRLEDKRHQLEQEKERQRKLELEKRQSSEINNFIAIKNNAELWHKAKMMREYLLAMEESAIKNGTYDFKVQEYIEWARKKVDWYDPLIQVEDELLEQLDKVTLTLPKKYAW